MVFETATVFPTPGGRAAALPAAALDLRLPEAGLRVLRQGRLGAVRAALHDRPAVQLRRHRRAAGAARQGGHVGQRQARDEPRRAGPGPEGAQGPGPAAHPRRRRAGPPLHLRRRPGPRHPARDRVAGGAQRGLQPLDRRLDDGARAGGGDLGQGTRRRTSRSASSPTRRSSTTSSCASPTSARRARSWASRPRRRSTRCSTRSSPGSRRRPRPVGSRHGRRRRARGPAQRVRAVDGLRAAHPRPPRSGTADRPVRAPLLGRRHDLAAAHPAPGPHPAGGPRFRHVQLRGRRRAARPGVGPLRATGGRPSGPRRQPTGMVVVNFSRRRRSGSSGHRSRSCPNRSSSTPAGRSASPAPSPWASSWSFDCGRSWWWRTSRR